MRLQRFKSFDAQSHIVHRNCYRGQGGNKLGVSRVLHFLGEVFNFLSRSSTVVFRNFLLMLLMALIPLVPGLFATVLVY